MALVNTSGYSRNQPSGSSSIRDSDDLFRSDKSIIENVLNTEHEFAPQGSASSLSGGLHKLGSARVFMNATRASLVTSSSVDSIGKLAYASDTQSLHVFGASSASTVVWGTQPPGARWSSNTTTHTVTGNFLQLAFAAEDWDVGGFGAVGANLATIPAGMAGRYLLTASVVFGSHITGDARLEITASNGSVIGMASGYSLTAGDGLSVTALEYCPSSGSTFAAMLFQSSGATVGLGPMYFAIQRL